MRNDLHMPYVPFVLGDLRKDKKGMYLDVTCPKCGVVVSCRERKDFESFTKREYAEHYSTHKSACCECGKPLAGRNDSRPIYCAECVGVDTDDAEAAD